MRAKPSVMALSLIALAALAAWIVLVFFRGGFWRADQRLGTSPAPPTWPAVAAVIPARDEAASIAAVVTAHMKSDYPGRLSIILIDDQSSDGTAVLARKAADDAASGRSLTVVTSSDLPAGWTGKLWAVQQGLEKARQVTPNADYVLLTDADIVLAPDALKRLAAKAENENLALTSLMARLDARGFWGGLLVPAFIYFFQKLYPFPRTNNPADNLAAAAGGVMLVRADALDAIGGARQFKSELIDDCALARFVKDLTPSTKIWLGLAKDEAVSLRDNRDLPDIWNMVARTAFAQLKFSMLMLAGTVAGMALIYLAPPLVALSFAWHGNEPALLLALTAWAAMAVSYWPTLRLYEQEPWQAPMLPIAATLYTVMTVSSAIRHWRGRGGQWKGRTY